LRKTLGLRIDGLRVYGFTLIHGYPFKTDRGVEGIELARVEVEHSLGRKRFILVTDLHIHSSSKGRVVARILSRIAGNSDIVVFGGDIWDEKTRSIDVLRESIEAMRIVKSFRIAVLGNHEEWARKIDVKEAIRLLEDNGFYVLLDDRMTLKGLVIAGYRWKPNPSKYPLDLARGADIVLVHSPDIFPYLDGNVVVLAGHTHGGQYCLPGARSIITNSRYGYTWGVFREKGKTMIVSRGVGEKRETRINCPRQIVIVEFERGEKNQ